MATSRAQGSAIAIAGQGVGDSDVASPFGGRYLTNDAADPLARDVQRVLQTLLRPVQDEWPDQQRGFGYALAGTKFKSPSVVWHSQALGALFEAGFAPTAKCTHP